MADVGQGMYTMAAIAVICGLLGALGQALSQRAAITQVFPHALRMRHELWTAQQRLERWQQRTARPVDYLFGQSALLVVPLMLRQRR